jgi:putative transposase
MKRSMGRRAYRRAVSDAAMGLVGPLLAYKTTRHGGVLVVADRWFASSQIHHGCTHPDGTACRLIGKDRIDKELVCPSRGKSLTVTGTLRAISVTGRITPVVAQSGPRPHRFPGQPHRRLVQAMARTSDHPAPAELP